MGPRIPRDKAAARHVLGPLLEHHRIAPFVVDDFVGGWSIEWDAVENLTTTFHFSRGEIEILRVAKSIYNRGLMDIGAVAAWVDDASWRRIIQGMTMLRGLTEEMHILPGEWVDGAPS